MTEFIETLKNKTNCQKDIEFFGENYPHEPYRTQTQ